MKKYFLSLTTILMVALTSVCFVSCGDDENDGSGTGTSTSSGVSVNAKYGFYRQYGGQEWEFNFSNHDLNSLGNYANSLDIVSIELNTDKEYAEIPTGEFTGGFRVGIVKDMKPGKDADIFYESVQKKNMTGKLTIKKNGGNYTVSYSGVDFYTNDSNTPTVTDASFTYTGGIAKLKTEK